MGNFHESSNNIWLEDGHILHAECGNGEGDYVESTLDLDYYIGNDDGSFSWGGESKQSNTSGYNNTDFTQTSLALLPTSPSTSKAMITFPFSAPS